MDIESSDGDRGKKHYKNQGAGRRSTISQVGGEGALRLHFLDMGLIPGAKVLLQKGSPMRDPIQILLPHGLCVRVQDIKVSLYI